MDAEELREMAIIMKEIAKVYDDIANLIETDSNGMNEKEKAALIGKAVVLLDAITNAGEKYAM